LPAKAASAPSAKARITSWPERMPLSSRMVAFLPTAATMAGRTSIDGISASI